MSTPNYNPNTPTRSQSFASWQPDFLANFQSLATIFANNHQPLTGATGNHTFVKLLEQSNPVQIGQGEVGLYSKDVEGQTDQLFLRYQGNGQEVLLTNYQIYSLGASSTSYFTFLPGNILVYFGQLNKNANPFTFNLKPAIAKNIITVNLCPIGITGASIPWVSVPTPQNGIYESIILNAGLNTNYSYIVLANV